MDDLFAGDVRIDVRVEREVFVLTLEGQLNVRTAVEIRRRANKCLVENPRCVLLDVAELEVVTPAMLSVFAVLAKDAAAYPGTELAVCGASEHVALVLRRIRARQGITVVPTTEESPEAAWCSFLRLPASPAAPGIARREAARVHARWGMPGSAGRAEMVVSELVTYATVEGWGPLELRLVRRDGMITESVSGPAPSTPAGTGAGPVDGAVDPLELITAIGSGWSSSSAGDVRRLWATVDYGPPPGAAGK